MSHKKLNLKKEYPELYNPGKTAEIIEVPKMLFFMADGQGNPNTSQEFQDVVKTLYGISYILKMKVVKKKTPNRDYVVPPLEGLWYVDNMEDWADSTKDDWKWTMMIRIPDHITSEEIDQALKIVYEKNELPALKRLRVEEYHEGTAVQIMYIGPYSDEHDTIMQIHQYASDNGYSLSGHHHEVYIGDPNRSKPENLKTIIRQPIKK